MAWKVRLRMNAPRGASKSGRLQCHRIRFETRGREFVSVANGLRARSLSKKVKEALILPVHNSNLMRLRDRTYVEWKSGEGRKFFVEVLKNLNMKPSELAKILKVPRMSLWFWVLERNRTPKSIVTELCKMSGLSETKILENTDKIFESRHTFKKENTNGFKKNDARTQQLSKAGYAKLQEFFRKNPERYIEAQKKAGIESCKNMFKRKVLVSDGSKVKSKEEKMIYEKYLSLGMKPLYEKKIFDTGNSVAIFDFYIPENDLFHEHMGVIKNEKYVLNKTSKLKIIASKFPEKKFLITVRKEVYDKVSSLLNDFNNVNVVRLEDFCAQG